MNEQLFVLCPGYIVYSNGNKHYVTYSTLMASYGLQKSQCKIFSDREAYSDETVFLHPRMATDYKQHLMDLLNDYTSHSHNMMRSLQEARAIHPS